MAGLTPMEVVNRVKMIEIPSELALTRKHQVCDGGCQQIESACTCGFLPFPIAVPPLITQSCCMTPCVVLQAENIFQSAFFDLISDFLFRVCRRYWRIS
jgi:hypothetical protein